MGTLIHGHMHQLHQQSSAYNRKKWHNETKNYNSTVKLKNKSTITSLIQKN